MLDCPCEGSDHFTAVLSKIHFTFLEAEVYISEQGGVFLSRKHTGFARQGNFSITQFIGTLHISAVSVAYVTISLILDLYDALI